ncbi:MAG: hypothetical protein QOH35_3055 [Acidobacteriaceae bacterium]|nr:hypothetical protein [Acidobacteriaceae bacterium]
MSPLRCKDYSPGTTKGLESWEAHSVEAFSRSTQTALRQDSWMRMRETAQTDQKKGMEENANPKANILEWPQKT